MRTVNLELLPSVYNLVKDEKMIVIIISCDPGKKDIWLPRSGHVVSLEVNSLAVPVSMVLDSEGRGYFPPRASPGKWSVVYCYGQSNGKTLHPYIHSASPGSGGPS